MTEITRLPSRFAAFLLISLLMLGCRQDHPGESPANDPGQLREIMTRANRALVKTENERIAAFIERYGWPMQQTKTGLWYWVYSHSGGRRPEPGDSLTLNYEVKLLDGSRVYSSETDGPLVFEPGTGKTINGLEEGVFLLHEKEKAKFIIPSHLAFGLLGDRQKIPQKATLVYDVELTSLSR